MMTIQETTDRLAHAREQGQAQFDAIVKLVADLTHTDMQTNDEAEQAIHEHPLEVLVRSDWHAPGVLDAGQDGPVEYHIILCTGGPVVQIIGRLSEHGEPETARLEVQDWFTPWTVFWPRSPEGSTLPMMHAEEILLAYARCFNFGDYDNN